MRLTIYLCMITLVLHTTFLVFSDRNPLTFDVDVFPPLFDVTGEVMYKGAYYSQNLDEIYYVIVEMEDGSEVTFFTPSFLWIQLKVGAEWKYEFVKKRDKDFIPIPLKGLTDEPEDV